MRTQKTRPQEGDEAAASNEGFPSHAGNDRTWPDVYEDFFSKLGGPDSAKSVAVLYCIGPLRHTRAIAAASKKYLLTGARGVQVVRRRGGDDGDSSSSDSDF